jgi:metallopeptidase MepB
MFYSAFNADPFSSKEGCKYRYTLLDEGGGQEETKTLTEILGQEPKTESFYTELSLE